MSLASTLKLENDVVSRLGERKDGKAAQLIRPQPLCLNPFPQFVAFSCSLLLLSLKMTFIAWHTVYFMVRYEKGMRNKEDL